MRRSRFSPEKCQDAYIDTAQGWLYLAVIRDLFSRMVVGLSMADHLDTSLIEAALTMALGRRSLTATLIHHSGHGCQYTSRAYQSRLAKLPVQVSMSRVGNCFDNAPAEPL